MTIPRHRLTARDAYRQAQEVSLLEQNFYLGVDARVWGTSTGTGGTVTHNAATAAARVGVTTASGSTATLRSHASPRAAIGRARCTVIVGHLQDLDTNRRARWGIFDDNEGFFFQVAGETLSTVTRIGGTDTVVAQTAFSEGDGRDWAGDLTYAHVFEIREAWPNGDIAWYIDGELMHVTTTGDGELAAPSCASPRAPLAVEVTNTAGASSSGHFATLSAAVHAEEAPISEFSTGVYAYDADLGTSLIPLLTIRPAATVNGVVNTADISPQTLTVRSAAQVRVQLLLGGAAASPTFAAAATGSVAEVDTAAASVVGGVVLAEFVGTEMVLDVADIVRRVGLQADGSQQELSVMAANLTTGIATAVALSWREIR